MSEVLCERCQGKTYKVFTGHRCWECIHVTESKSKKEREEKCAIVVSKKERQQSSMEECSVHRALEQSKRPLRSLREARS